MITKEAMITICTMIRIEPGIWLRSTEMNIELKPVTAVTASAITKATCREEVTASAEQMLLHVDARKGGVVPASGEVAEAISRIAAAHSTLDRPAAVGRHVGQR